MARAIGQADLTAAGGQVIVRPGWLTRASAGWALAGICLAALALRLWAITWALPFTVNVDEPVVVDQASGILLTGDLNPHRFVYPSLQIYLQAAISWAHLQWGLATGLYSGLDDLPASTHTITSAPGFYLWGRAGTAALGALTVLFTGLAGRWAGGWRVGLIAAAMVAVSPLHVGHSRTVTPDVPASSFTALALLGALAVLRQPATLTPGRRRWLYLLAGVAFGLATATKYNAVVIGASLLIAHLMARPPRHWLAGDIWLAGAASVIAFFAVTPFALIDRGTFLQDVASIIIHYRTGHAGYESDQNWWWYLRWLLTNEIWLTAPALLGLIWAAARHRRHDVVLLAFVLLSYAGLASYRVHFNRNLLPLFPVLALLAARVIADLSHLAGARWPRLRPAVLPLTLGCGALLVLVPAQQAVDITAYQARPDSRSSAVAWAQANLPADTRALADLHPLLFEDSPVIHATAYVAQIHARPPEWFRARGYTYLVTSGERHDKYFKDRARYAREVAAYERLFVSAEEVARFNDENGHVGPEVRVLRLSDMFAEPALERRLDRRLGAFELLGANMAATGTLHDVVMTDEGTPTVKPGGVLGLTLVWRAWAPVNDDFKLLARVLDEQGRTVARRDLAPLRGEYPTSEWQIGEVVIDPANIALPATLAPGTYRIQVELYHPETGDRLPARPPIDGPDRIEVGVARVAP